MKKRIIKHPCERDDRENTSAQDLKKIANRLMTASLKSKLDVSVKLRIKKDGLEEPDVDMIFFNNDDIFSITFYAFYPKERNKKFLDLALALMKDHTRYEEIKKEFDDERFRR